jgi:hypothetical protein
MKEHFIFEIRPHTHKHLLFVDKEGFAAIPSIAQIISEMKGKYELHIIGDLCEENLASLKNNDLNYNYVWKDCKSAQLLDYLKNQRIGTKIYISASWNVARKLETAAETAGFSPEEIQVHGYGPEYQQVFCVSCYTIHPIDGQKTMICNNCKKTISVSNHYSRRLDAVLGYLILQERKAET